MINPTISSGIDYILSLFSHCESRDQACDRSLISWLSGTFYLIRSLFIGTRNQSLRGVLKEW